MVDKEAKTRRSTRSVVLGKAKVISYEDLKEVRAKRTARETAMMDKGKGISRRRRKRPRPAPENGAFLLTESEVLELTEVSVPWRAPIARMY